MWRLSGGFDWMPNRTCATNENENVEVFKARVPR